MSKVKPPLPDRFVPQTIHNGTKTTTTTIGSFYWRLVDRIDHWHFSIYYRAMECRNGTERERLLFHCINVRLVCSYLRPESGQRSARRNSGNQFILWPGLVRDYLIYNPSHCRALECRTSKKRKRLLCHGLYIEHVFSNYCAKEYTGLEVNRKQRRRST